MVTHLTEECHVEVVAQKAFEPAEPLLAFALPGSATDFELFPCTALVFDGVLDGLDGYLNGVEQPQH